MPAPNALQAGVLLDTGDSSASLIAAPSTGNTIYIKAIHWSVVTVAAQAVYVGKASGTAAQKILHLVASATGVGSRYFDCNNNRGFKMPKETALTATPAAAGPAILFIVEYVIEPN